MDATPLDSTEMDGDSESNDSRDDMDMEHDCEEIPAAIPAPQPSPQKRYRCKDPELLQATSPRLFGKQAAERVVTMKRTNKLCQSDGCVFSVGQPGQPARADGTVYCVWCDAEGMKKHLQKL